MNGKLASKNYFWKWISRTEGENDEIGIRNSGEISRLNKIIFSEHVLTQSMNSFKMGINLESWEQNTKIKVSGTLPYTYAWETQWRKQEYLTE